MAHNTAYRLIAEAGYPNTSQNRLRYEWKIDDHPFEQYSAFNGLNITTIGAHNNLALQEAVLDITFGGDIKAGSTVVIRIQDMHTLSKDIIFKVE